MKLKEIIKRKPYLFFCAFCALSLVLICYFFPYIHDDWAWGSRIGINRLNIFFKDYNGRYMGNLIEILITRFHLIRVIIEAGIIMLIIYLSNKFIFDDAKAHNGRFLIILSLLLMPVVVIAESIAWAAGFTNYVIPMALVLIFWNYNKKIFDDEYQNHKYNLWTFIGLFIVGFLASLFVEHVTLYNFALCLFIIIYELIKTKKVSINNIGYSIGSLLGTISMFSNGAYLKVFESTDSYRSIGGDNFIIKALSAYTNIISKYIFTANNFIILALSIVVLLLIKKYLKNEKNKVLSIIKYVFIFFIAYEFFYVIGGNTNLFLISRHLKIVMALLLPIYFISLFITIMIIFKKNRFKYIFVLLSIVVLTGPLLVVSPLSARCFFPMYLLESILLVQLFMELKINEKQLNIIKPIIACLLCFFIYVYGSIFYVNSIRENLSYNVDDTCKVLYLPKLPYSQYMKSLAFGKNTPLYKEYVRRYKLFYNIDQSVEVQFINFDDWKKLEVINCQKKELKDDEKER